MKLFAAFSRAYPAQSAIVLGALVLASLFEGVGLTTLLPLLTTRGTSRIQSSPPHTVERAAHSPARHT